MKTISKTELNLITTENLGEVLAYLGWHELPAIRGGVVRQFVSPNGEHSALLPPKSLSDYYRILIDSIEEIAAFEHKTIEEFVNKLLNPSYDIMKWRIASNATNKGRIPFFDMTDAIDRIKDMMATACLDTMSPQKYHSMLYTADVKKHLESYSFGQTEIGSYIINLLCPLGNYEYVVFNPDEKLPLNRKININLLSSVNEIQDNLLNDNKTKFDEDVDSGKYSVNFLDSLGEMYIQTKDVEMNISADWNPKILNPQGFNLSTVKLIPRCCDDVQAIAEKYRPKKEQNTSKTYYGKISEISANPELENREIVRIKIATIGDNEQKINVNANLNYATYNSVVQEAFGNGLDIRLSGVMTLKGNVRWIEEGSLTILR